MRGKGKEAAGKTPLFFGLSKYCDSACVLHSVMFPSPWMLYVSFP